MSMTNAAGEGWAGVRRFQFWGNRSRISWGAVLAGAAVAAAASLSLNLLGAAFGAGPVAELRSASSELARGAGLWEIVSLALSMTLGGYVSSRLSGTHSHLDGELHGMTMWAVAVLIGLLAFARLFVGGIGFEVGPATTLAPSALATNPERLIDHLTQSLGSSGDPTTMSREQIAAQIRDLAGESLLTAGGLADSDRTRLIALVAAQFGITKDEAAQRVAHMEDEAKARVAQFVLAARADADETTQGAIAGARALFPALALGLLGALVGAWLGTRHKRVLHPPEAEHVAAGGYGVHEVAADGYGVHEPASLSIYDDAGHLVAQYLRGVSFPVTKQDLVRFARSSHVGPAFLHSIEGLADRSYANADDVLGALGALH